MTLRVEYTPRAIGQLEVLYLDIAIAAAPAIADRYIGAIVEFCDGLYLFPHRGNRRDDIRPGLRITHYRKRAVIAFDVDTERVEILGVFYGGQDYEIALQESSDE